MKKGYTLPSKLLQEYIDRYWFWESEDNEVITLPNIYPGSGTEMVFHYRVPFKGYPTSHILSPRSKNRYSLQAEKNTGFISVRFKSWAFTYFTRIPANEIINRVINAEEIWGVRGREVGEKIGAQKSFQEKCEILNNFFEDLLIKGVNQNREIDWAINYIYYNFNRIPSLDEIVSDTNLSLRTFQRRVKESVGVSPKRFLKISRFQTVLKRSLLTRSYPHLDTILGAGYYDQSHFNKDFKSLTGENPTRIIDKENYLSHFYNTSIKK